MKIAVITPYYDEPPHVLRRCLESVKQQSDIESCEVVHFFISDGVVSDFLVQTEGIRHIILGSSHNDNGNTPRAVGGLLARNEGFEAIFYLDADNLYLKEHISSAVTLSKSQGLDVVFSSRLVFFPDGDCYDFNSDENDEDSSKLHVDTSCIALFNKALKTVGLWGDMPREYGPVCDRVFFQYLKSNFQYGWTNKPTMLFETWYSGHFVAANKILPPNAKQIEKRSEPEWENVYHHFIDRSLNPWPLLIPQGWVHHNSRSNTSLIRVSASADRDVSTICQIIQNIQDINVMSPSEFDDISSTFVDSEHPVDSANRLDTELDRAVVESLSSKPVKGRDNHIVLSGTSNLLEELRCKVGSQYQWQHTRFGHIVLIPDFFEYINSKCGVLINSFDVERSVRIPKVVVEAYFSSLIKLIKFYPPRQLLLLPSVLIDSLPVSNVAQMLQHFIRAPYSPWGGFITKKSVLNLKSLSYFSVNSKYEDELYHKYPPRDQLEIKRSNDCLELEAINNSDFSDAPSLDQSFTVERIMKSLLLKKDQFSFLIKGLPESSSLSDANFKPIPVISQAAELFHAKSAFSRKYFSSLK